MKELLLGNEAVARILSESFDLYVTATEKDKEIFNDVVRSFPDAKTAVVENKGYDAVETA